jgi:hypothetical protein
LSEESKKDLEESEKLAEEIEGSPDKENREEAIKQICIKKLSGKGFLGFKKADEKDLEECISDYKAADLKKKTNIKKEYIGKQCHFNPGIAIECPEGVYKFVGSSGLSNVNGEEREEGKEVDEKEEKEEKEEKSEEQVSEK